MKLFLLPLLACGLWAQDAAPPAARPAVSDKARASFWRASAELIQANAVKTAAEAKQKDAVDAIQKECGSWRLELDKTGEPACVEVAPPSATPSKPEDKK